MSSKVDIFFGGHNRPLIGNLLAALAAILLAPCAFAEPFYLKGSDTLGTSSMSGLGSCAGWTNASGVARTAAVANEDYVVDNGFTIRSPNGNGNYNYDYTFPGASLTVVKGTVSHGGAEGKKLTIGDLRVPEGGACNLAKAGNSRNLAWGGNYSIAEGGVLTITIMDDRKNSVSAGVSGAGTLRFEAREGWGTQFLDVLTGDLSSFTGSIEMRRPSILEFASAASIPGDPPAGTTSSVVVTNGATLVVDYDWMSPTNRVWDFGDGARPTIYVAEGKTLIINGEITGSAGFWKTGAGTLILASGGDFGCIWRGGEFAATRSTPAEPKVVVTNMVAGGLLVKGADYDVAYSNHLVSSTGYAIVTGKGTYAGREVVLPYSIDHKLSARDFRYCMTVAPTSGKVTTTLADFPVLLRLSAATQSGFRPAACGDGGSNLRVTLPDGTLLAHEIDHWDAEGECTVWVNVPSLASDTVLYVLWSPDGGYTPPAPDPAETWPDYVGVWHFSEASGVVRDSSANGFDSTNDGGGTVSNLNAKVGLSRNTTGTEFDTGVTSLVAGSNAKTVSTVSKFTFSGWMLSTVNFSSNPIPIHKGVWNKGGWYMNFVGSPTRINAIGSGTAAAVVSLPVSVYNNWVYITIVYNGATASIYENGALVGSGSVSTVADSSHSLGLLRGFTGRADEFRIRDGVETAAYIAAEYATMADGDFLTYGEVVRRPGFVYYLR